MGKWTAFGSLIQNERGGRVARAKSFNIAAAIVREHNAHEALVLCLSAMLKTTCGECRGEDFEKCRADELECALSAQARAALALAEGREECSK